jgi:hypothetical protein
MTRHYHLGIIGTGQIGSRHLQALALIDRPVSIQVVDPSPASLKTARERFNEVKGSGNVEHVEYLKDISEMTPELDCVLIATKADIRRQALEQLLAQKHVSYLILEKVLFQKKNDFEAVDVLLNRYNVKTWVNFPRRVWPIYQELKKELTNVNTVDFNVTGSRWGIGCNTLHFLDLFAFFTNCADMDLLGDYLDSKTVPAERAGFIEFTGTLLGSNMAKDRFSVTSYPTGNAPLFIQITSSTARFLINENEGMARVSEENDRWKWREISFSIPYQSQLTHLVVQKILDTGKSDLASYEEAWKIHVPFLEALLTHLEKNCALKVDACPIT